MTTHKASLEAAILTGKKRGASTSASGGPTSPAASPLLGPMAPPVGPAEREVLQHDCRSDSWSQAALRILDCLHALPCPSRGVLLYSRIGLSIKKASRHSILAVSIMAVSIMARWQGALCLREIAEPNSDYAERVRDAARVGLAAVQQHPNDDAEALHSAVDEMTTTGKTASEEQSVLLRGAATYVVGRQSTLADAAALFSAQGLCHMPEAMDPAHLAQLHDAAVGHAKKLLGRLEAVRGAKGLQTHDAVYSYAECAQRSAGRLDFRVGQGKSCIIFIQSKNLSCNSEHAFIQFEG